MKGLFSLRLPCLFLRLGAFLAALCWTTPAGAQTAANDTFTGNNKFFCMLPWIDVSGSGISGFSAKYTVVTQPVHGTVTIDPSQSDQFLFTGTTDYTGPDSFTWSATSADGRVTTNVATMTLNLVANAVPVAKPATVTAQSGVQTTSIVNLLTYTTHPDTSYTQADYGQKLTYTITSQPANGTATINTQQTNRSNNKIKSYIDYCSASGFTGTDSFKWTVSDGFGNSNEATVTVNVIGQPPVPSNQSAVAVKNTPLTIYPVYTGGVGWPAGSIKVGIAGNSTNGTVTTDGNNFTYSPKTGYVGADSFTWNMIYSGTTTQTSGKCSITVRDPAASADWTQWCADECRTGFSPVAIPPALNLQWRIDLPAASGALDTCVGVYSNGTLTTDLDNCRPVQLGKVLFVPTLANDRITAYNTDTGAELWRYYAGGPLRRPPVATTLPDGKGALIFGCDDGYVYCLNAADGTERWKFLAAPNTKKAMGFKRLSSIWPVWGSPVLYNGKVYFVAGLLPSQGLIAWCLDAATGSVVWCNDGRLMGKGWSSSLGPLTFSTDHTKIFGTNFGSADPWIMDPSTGELAGYYSRFSISLGWFVDGTGNGGDNDPLKIVAGGQTITASSAQSLPGFSGTVASLLVGDGKLFVSANNGGTTSIYCYGTTNVGNPKIWPNTSGATPLPATTDVWTSAVQTMLSRDDLKQGLALVWGVGSGRLVTELAKQAPNMTIVAADPDPAKIRALRILMDGAGLSGSRVSTLTGNPMECGFAPYQAAIIASEDASVAGATSNGGTFDTNGQALVGLLYNSTRPFGGEIWLPTTSAQSTAISGWLSSANFPTCNSAASYTLFPMVTGFSGLAGNAAGFTRVQRTGLPDAAIAMVPPFRVIAFDGPTNGNVLMFNKANATGKTFQSLYSQYASKYNFADQVNDQFTKGLQASSGVDIYSWLPATAPEPGYEPAHPAFSNETTTAWPVANLFNPIYQRQERAVGGFNTLNCDSYHSRGNLTFAPGRTSYFADTQNYWGSMVYPEIGACNKRPGTAAGNGLVMFAAGVLGCPCDLDVRWLQFGVVSTQDPTDECWQYYSNGTSRKNVQDSPLQRIGINFGAPGDRYEPARQMVWTHFPNGGKRSESTPLVPVTYTGTATARYHSASMLAASNPPRGFVSPSSIQGMTGITVPVARPLVLKRAATPPTIDGTLTDACWANATRINLPMPGGDSPIVPPEPRALADQCYALLCYDDNNLYIAGGRHVAQSASQFYTWWDNCIRISLNSREQTGRSIQLVYSPCWSQQQYSQGLANTDWQAASQRMANGTTTPADLFTVEVAIPWSKLAAAGIWKGQLIMNVAVCGSALFGKNQGTVIQTPSFTDDDSSACLGPVFFDTVHGVMAQSQPHTVKLYFNEMDGMAPGQRVFDVSLQGQTVLTGLDVSKTAGQKTELVKQFDNVMFSDHLDVGFNAKAGSPMLSGLEIVNTGTGTQLNVPPVAVINATDPSTGLPVTSGTAPLTVSLSAQRSYDPDGQILECVWDTGDGRLIRGSSGTHVFTDPGTYKVSLLVMDDRGAITATNTTITVNAGAPAAFVCAIRTSGGDFTSLTTWNTAIASDLTAPGSLLFTVSNPGTYAATDDGSTVTFTGGGTGVLRHLNTGNIAYITGCTGTIQAGLATCGAHSFTVSDTGHQIYAAVAEGYKDWPKGLSTATTLSGWTTDANHCVVIRSAAGNGHGGKMKDSQGNYTGFAITGSLDVSAAPYTRLIGFIHDNVYPGLFIANGGSVNRMVANMALPNPTATPVLPIAVANSVFTSKFSSNWLHEQNVGIYHCTAPSFLLRNSTTDGSTPSNCRTVNCLSFDATGKGFTNYPGMAISEAWLNHCVSRDASATTWDSLQEGRGGNVANQAVNFTSTANGDFSFAASETGAVGRGVPGLGNDVAGNPRLGPTYDVGAFQTGNTGKSCTLSGSVPSAGSISLQWTFNGSGGEDGFLVEVSTDNGTTFTKLLNLPVTTTSLATSTIPTSAGAQIYRVTATISGTVSVVSNTLSLTPFTGGYSSWLAAHSLPADGSGNGAMTACPANDGIANLAKYALGIDPNKPGYQGNYSTGTYNDPATGLNYLSLTYTRPEPALSDVHCIPESGADLAPGSFLQSNTVEMPSTPSGGFRTITVRDNTPAGTAPRRFLRLRFTSP